MTQQDLNDAVARATGEDVRHIQRLGFSLADPREVDFDPEPNDLPPQVLDWDNLDCVSLIPAVASLDDLIRRAA